MNAGRVNMFKYTRDQDIFAVTDSVAFEFLTLKETVDHHLLSLNSLKGL